MTTEYNLNNVHIVQHPLLQHKITYIRDQATPYQFFRQLTHEISLLLCYEATKSLRLRPHEITTPLGEHVTGQVIANNAPVIIPILRAGLAMIDAFLAVVPNAKIGHIGLFRDEKTHQSNCYYFNIPKDSASRTIFLCDPMLATGGSASHAVSMLKEKGLQDIHLVSIIGAPEGLTTFQNNHPDVPITLASLDRELSPNAYILPGLGDAGDRICGTY